MDVQIWPIPGDVMDWFTDPDFDLGGGDVDRGMTRFASIADGGTSSAAGIADCAISPGPAPRENGDRSEARWRHTTSLRSQPAPPHRRRCRSAAAR